MHHPGTASDHGIRFRGGQREAGHCSVRDRGQSKREQGNNRVKWQQDDPVAADDNTN